MPIINGMDTTANPPKARGSFSESLILSMLVLKKSSGSVSLERLLGASGSSKMAWRVAEGICCNPKPNDGGLQAKDGGVSLFINKPVDKANEEKAECVLEWSRGLLPKRKTPHQNFISIWR